MAFRRAGGRSKLGRRPPISLKPKPAKVAATVVVNGIRYMTLAEYAAWKRVSYWTVRRAKLRGEIESERIGKSDRIPVRVG
jgi:hypothetical protein